MDGLLGAVRSEVVLAAGEHDAMGPPAHLRALVPDALQLDGVGHNAHVEDRRQSSAASSGMARWLASLRLQSS